MLRYVTDIGVVGSGRPRQRHIGIEKGKPFAPDARMKKILTEAAAVGDAKVRGLLFRGRIPEAFYYPNSTWRQWLGGYKFESQPGSLTR